jgi:putative acetyltransferase
MPHSQKTGVGTALAEKGMLVLSDAGAQLVFVLGHPAYYPRFGFSPAGELGFEATYPILEKNAGAWMVKALAPHIIGKYSGKVICADTMNRPEYWAE